MINITYGFLEFEKIWTSREREERYIDRMAASEENVKKREKGLKITIIVLSLLVAASLLALAAALAARYIYLALMEPTQATVTVPDNLVGEEGGAQGPETTGEGGSGSGETGGTPSGEASPVQAHGLELYDAHPGDNERFEAVNLFPGDRITKYYCVRAYHDADVTLQFRADVTEETKNLGDVLRVKVTHLDTGEVLCDAPFSEIDGEAYAVVLPVNAQQETSAYYQVEVSLDTSVGNEYQAAHLKADLNWNVPGGVGLIESPDTGDAANTALWIVLTSSALTLIVLLAVAGRRRKGEAEHA